MNKRTKNRINKLITKHFYDNAIPYSWPFTDDLVSAMHLFEKLRKCGKWCCLKISSDYNYVWDVILVESEQSGRNAKHEPTIVVTGEDLPLTICRAALKSINITYESKKRKVKRK